MFNRVMSKVHIVKGFLEGLLGRKVENIEYHEAQSASDLDYEAKSVRFDVKFVGDGVVYDIEMQNKSRSSLGKNREELIHRARYYHANMCMAYLDEGQSYKELPPCIVIFICTYDLFGKGFACYTQMPAIKELRAFIQDGSRTIYLNPYYTQANVSEIILNFLDYLKDPHNIQGSLVSSIDRVVKESKKSVEERSAYMSLKEMMAEEREEGYAEGMEEAIKRLMTRRHITRSEAEDMLGLSDTSAETSVSTMHLH